MSRAALFFGLAHALPLLRLRLSAAPLTERQAGDPCSANSAAPQGCMGQGYGAAGPMSTLMPSVPVAIARNRSAWLSVAAFVQPLTDAQLAAFARRVAAPAGPACAARAGAAAIDTPPSNTGVNKVSGEWAW